MLTVSTGLLRSVHFSSFFFFSFFLLLRLDNLNGSVFKVMVSSVCSNILIIILFCFVLVTVLLRLVLFGSFYNSSLFIGILYLFVHHSPGFFQLLVSSFLWFFQHIQDIELESLSRRSNNKVPQRVSFNFFCEWITLLFLYMLYNFAVVVENSLF